MLGLSRKKLHEQARFRRQRSIAIELGLLPPDPVHEPTPVYIPEPERPRGPPLESGPVIHVMDKILAIMRE